MTAARYGLAAALLAAAPATLAGQTTGPAREVFFHAAAGVAAPFGGALDGFDPGWTVALGLRLSPPESSPLSLQLDVLHARLTDEPFVVPLPADGFARVEPRTAVTSVGAAVVLAPRERRHMHAYLLAGAAYYRLSRDDRGDAGDVFIEGTNRRDAAGVSYGGGIEGRVGRLAPFLELRQHIIFNREDDTSLVPLVVGLRF